jgi:hypothetical protein
MKNSLFSATAVLALVALSAPAFAGISVSERHGSHKAWLVRASRAAAAEHAYNAVMLPAPEINLVGRRYHGGPKSNTD